MRTPPVRRLAYLAALIATATLAAEPVAPDFSHYGQTEAMKARIAEHAAGQFHCLLVSGLPGRPPMQGRWADHEALLLAITVFYRDSAGSALRYLVTENGTAFDCRDLYSIAIQDSHSHELSNEQLTHVASAIEKLPTENTYPALSRLAIVSFRRNGVWETHTMPQAAIQRTLEIVGERFETKKVR